MPQLIPLVADTPFYRFDTTLDSIQYIFDVRWNSRDNAWYVDISSEDETRLVTGIKLVLGQWLTGNASHADRPYGLFLASDWSGTSTEPTLENIGVTVGIYFYSLEELDNLGFV